MKKGSTMSDTDEVFTTAFTCFCVPINARRDIRGLLSSARVSGPARLYESPGQGIGLTDGIRIQQAGCLDRCELGPMMVVYP